MLTFFYELDKEERRQHLCRDLQSLTGGCNDILASSLNMEHGSITFRSVRTPTSFLTFLSANRTEDRKHFVVGHLCGLLNPICYEKAVDAILGT